jgi:hypothetical protein
VADTEKINDNRSSVKEKAENFATCTRASTFTRLEPDIRHAVLGNASTIISFRLGAVDAQYIEREFLERFLTKLTSCNSPITAST